MPLIPLNFIKESNVRSTRLIEIDTLTSRHSNVTNTTKRKKIREKEELENENRESTNVIRKTIDSKLESALNLFPIINYFLKFKGSHYLIISPNLKIIFRLNRILFHFSV